MRANTFLSVSDWVSIKCLCASSRWELLWRLCREFQSESEQKAALRSEGKQVVEEGWKEEGQMEEEVEEWREEVVEEGWKEEEEEEVVN